MEPVVGIAVLLLCANTLEGLKILDLVDKIKWGNNCFAELYLMMLKRIFFWNMGQDWISQMTLPGSFGNDTESRGFFGAGFI